MSNVEESLETQARIGALRCEGGPHSPTGGLLRRLADEIERLRAELSKHQESEFHPDWSMLEATRSSLREHQQMVRALRAEVAASKDAQVDAYYCGRKDGEAEHDRLRAQVADHKAAFNKLNEVLAENLEDRKRLRAEIAKLREAADNNDAAFIDRMTVERTRLRALLRMAGAALRGIHEGRRHPQPALSIIARIDAALSKEKS